MGLTRTVKEAGRSCGRTRFPARARSLRTVLDLELGEYARDVIANGLFASAEVCRNLQVVAPVGQQVEHVAFTRRQHAESRTCGSRDRQKSAYFIAPATPHRLVREQK